MGQMRRPYNNTLRGRCAGHFPPGTRLRHWILILLTGLVFLLGFATRWQCTPFATITMYATLATLCFVETVDFRAFGDGMKTRLPSGAWYRASALLLLCLGASGCSNQNVYNAIQESQRVNCQQYPDTRYEACMQQLDKPYGDYEAEREALAGE